MKKLVDREFLDHFNHKYPALKDETLRDLLMYISFGTQIDDDSKELLLSYDILARIAEKSEEASNAFGKGFSGRAFLESFKELFPGFDYSEHQRYGDEGWTGKCRRLIDSGLDDQDKEAIRAELASTSPKEDKFYFRTGYKFHKSKNADIRKQTTEEFLNAKSVFYPKMNATQRKIFDALQPVALNGEHFTKKLNENHDHIKQAIASLKAKPDDKISLQEKRELQYKIVQAIGEDGRIFYSPTRHMRTSRLHATNTSAISLASDVRKALFKGWWEVDFISSQFVILTSLLGVQEAKDILGNGKTLWQNLGDMIGRPSITKQEKGCFKTAIYAICFGSSVREVEAKLGQVAATELLNTPLFVSLLSKRDAKLAQITKAKSVCDVWGERHYIEPEKRKTDIFGQNSIVKARWAGSLLATLIQSVEMEIISAVFDVKLKRDAKIMAFQHDGFAMWVDAQANIATIQEKMDAAIAEKSAEVGALLGIDLSKMKLEFEAL